MANPSLAMIPSGYKAGTLYSVLPTDGISDFTVDRNSIATRVNEQGLIEEVAVNVPRLDYSDGGCPVLLTEPESTNLVLYSEPTTTQNGDNGITYENYSWSNGFTNCIKYDYPISEVFFYKAGSAIASTENTLSVFVIMDDLSKPSFGEGVTNDAYMRIATIKSTNYTYKNCGNNIWRVSGTATSGSIYLDANDIQKDTANSLKGFRV